MEYAQFGESIVKRENADHEWEVCAEDDIDARVAMGIKESKRETRATNGAPKIGTEIFRSDQNTEIAERYGLTADQLAERLAGPNDNRGTVKRQPEKEFKADMAKLGHSSEDAKARFNGTFWDAEAE